MADGGDGDVRWICKGGFVLLTVHTREAVLFVFTDNRVDRTNRRCVPIAPIESEAELSSIKKRVSSPIGSTDQD